jgi:FAD-dependent oxidoreductase domain-containing protein 1
MRESYEVVIAGGAVMGSSIAYHLAAHPAFAGRILVIDKDMTYRRAASSLSLSSIRQQFSSPINIRAGLYGVSFLRRAPDILAVDGERPDLPLVENGYLYLASAAGAPILAANHAAQTREGADVVLLDPDALTARFPFINRDGIAAAAWGRSGEGWFDGYSLMQAFRRKARALGADYREAEVVGVERAGGRVAAVRLADGGRIGCGAFVDAAGALGAARLAESMGFSIPVHPRKRCVFQFAARERIARCPLIVDIAGAYVRSEGDSYLCGISPPESDDPDSEDFEVVWSQFEDLIWPALAARIPAFEAIRPGRAWAGHYDLNTFDHNAIVGRAPGLDNAYLAAGFSGHGMQQSPAVGRGLAELVVEGHYASLDLGDFGYERIAAGRPLLERNVI